MVSLIALQTQLLFQKKTRKVKLLFLIGLIFLCSCESASKEAISEKYPENFWGLKLEDILIEKSPKIDDFGNYITVDDLMTPEEEEYAYPSGAIYNSKPYSGVALELFPSDKIKSILTFREGLLHGAVLFFDEDGTISYKCSYYKGIQNGPSQNFLSSNIGKYLFEEGGYFNGKRTGFWMTYNEHNQLLIKTYYHQDNVFGSEIVYSDNGQIEKITSYSINKDRMSVGNTIYQTYRSASKDGSIPSKLLKSKMNNK